MQLNPSEISELIKSRIQNLESGSELRTQGTVVSVTDGIVRVHGLAEVMQGEMLEFPGNTFGMALNLERDRRVAKECYVHPGGDAGPAFGDAEANSWRFTQNDRQN